MTTPSSDGQILRYLAGPDRGPDPRIYYVNGIRVMPDGHAKEATMLSFHAERTVYGVYNMTGKEQVRRLGADGKIAVLQEVGSIVDLLQCGTDWLTSFTSQLAESGTGLLNKGQTAIRDGTSNVIGFVNDKTGANLRVPSKENPVDVAAKIRSKLSPLQREKLVKMMAALTNPAAVMLFEALNTHKSERQWIVAHSQGNLVAADALWMLSIAHGDETLSNIRVFSLASPVPAWPKGIDNRRKVYGHVNDLVTLADPHNWTILTEKVLNGRFGRVAGDWRQHGASKLPGLAPHDMKLNVEQLNFLNRFRRDLGLPEYETNPKPPGG